MATPVTIRIQNDDPSPSRVVGVVVQIYTTLGVLVTSGLTDVNGEAFFLVPDADYDVLLYKQGLTILPKQPQRFTVDEDLSNVFLITGHESTLPESTNPLRCRITGYLIGSNGLPTKDQTLLFLPKKEIIVLDTNVVSPGFIARAQADGAGYFDFELLRGLEYEAYFNYKDSLLGQVPPSLCVITPDQPALALYKLLFPLPVNCAFSAGTKSLSLGADPDSSLLGTVTYNDGSVRTRPSIWGTLKVTVSDPTIVEASLADGRLILKPLASGVATVSTERIVNTQALWRPLPTYTTGSVVVTVA